VVSNKKEKNGRRGERLKGEKRRVTGMGRGPVTKFARTRKKEGVWEAVLLRVVKLGRKGGQKRKDFFLPTGKGKKRKGERGGFISFWNYSLEDVSNRGKGGSPLR